MSRARGAGRPDCLLCPGCRAWVIVLIYVTVGAKWSTDKVQFDGYSVVRFGAGAAAPARARARPAAPFAARGRSPRRDQERQAAGRRAAAVIAGAGPRAWRLPWPGAGVLPPAAGRGLPDQQGGLGDPGRGRGPPGRGRASAVAGPAAAADRRLPVRRAGPGELPPRRLGVGDPRGLPPRRHGGPGLR